MEPMHSKKLKYFMRLSVLLDRSFFSALLLICFSIFALSIFLFYNAKHNAAIAYTQKAQAVTVSLSTLLDSYFSRVMETQEEFIDHNDLTEFNDNLKNKIDILAGIIKLDNVMAVTLVSRDMKLLYSSPHSNAHGTDLSLLPHIQYLQKHKTPLISSPFKSLFGYRAIAVVSPFFDKNSEYAGALCYLIDFESLVKSFFKDVNMREYERSWIFDQTCSMISDPGSVLLNHKRISIDRRRLMTYALAKQNGISTYERIFPDGIHEKYIVCFSAIPLDGETKWVICVEAPADMVYKSAEGFPIVYSVPLLLFFFLIIVLMLMKRYFGCRYVSILENVIISSHDARKEIESRLAAIMESFPYFIFETDTDGAFTFLIVAPELCHGSDVDLLQNKNIKDLIDSSYEKSFNDAFSRLLNNGHLLNHLRVTMKLMDDKDPRIMSLNASPLYDEEKKIVGTRGVMHDITERVELELNLIQSQKMDAVGMVTAGIAHDFNNYLCTILGYITMMKMKGNKSEELNSLEQAAKNATNLTGQLMSFSRGHETDKEEHCADLNKTLSTIVDILKKSLPFSINLKLNIEPNLPAIKATSAKIDQIVMNLVINARDAMPEGGEIIIKVWSLVLNDIYSSKLDLLPGKYVILNVTDNGQGVAEETKNRIFEPYFTTKKTGTGLGLATVYAIVKNLGGNILVKSTLGEGTEFVIYIPHVSGHFSSDKCKRLSDGKKSPSNSVLIVEDDKILSELMVKSFKSTGFKVFTAENGYKGLQIYKKQKKSIDIIISDVIMEHMNGIEMVKEIRKINSKIAVLFITGHRIDKGLKEEMNNLRAHVLEKPFKVPELIEYVNKFFTAFKGNNNDKKS